MPLPRRPNDRPLNAELERLLYQEKVILQEAEGLYWGLSDEQMNWAPAPGQWSMAQCLDHLNLTNRKMADGIEASMKSGRAAGLLSDGPFTYGFLARWFHRSLQPPVKRKFKAPPPFVPAPQKRMADILPEWDRTHERITSLIRDCNGLDLARIKVASPASRLLKYSLGIAFWIQTAHDRRHLWQMRQIRNHPEFPAQ
ncbi:MAG: DinB family protein [Acidobacteria bacterium]|nr:DinB family protein [Acidobacteriota bacterium]